MHKHTGESGAALVLLIGITAALLILSAVAVMALSNQQNATAGDRSHKTSTYYAEAALDSAVNAAKGKTNVATPGFLTPEEMAVNYDAAYPAGPDVTYRVYDNQTPVNTAITCDEGKPGDATDPDGMVWLEVTTTYLGKASRLRVLVVQTTESVVQAFPKAAIFSDANIKLQGSSDTYAVNDDGTPYVPNPPGNYKTRIMAGGSVTGNSNTNFAAPGSSVQSIGVQANGTLSGCATGQTGFTRGGVPLLSDYFNQADQAALMFEAQAGGPSPGSANAGAPAVSATTITSNSTYGGVNGVTAADVKVSGNLTLGAGTRYFRSLYVTGNLTQQSGGTFNCTALYVGGNLTISGTSGTCKIGPTFVAGSVTWTGSGTLPAAALSVQTTNWSIPAEEPGPLWVGSIFTLSGPFNHVLGPTWVAGNAGTADVAFAVTGPASGTSSTVLCPLLATTEKIRTVARCDFGTLDKPMVLYMVCDNDNLYSNTCEWGSTGTFTGLMVLMEAAVTPSGGNNGIQPNIVGALFCIKDVTISSNTSISYNQAVLDHLQAASITTTTTKTTVLPGTWQELSANSN